MTAEMLATADALNQTLASIALDSALFVALGGLCLVLIAVSLLRRLQQGGAIGRAVTRAERAQLREQRELKRELEDLLGQLDELARRVDAQVGSQLNRLEQAVRTADERIKRLEGSAVRKSAESEPPVTHAAQPAPATPAEARAGGAESNVQRVHELADTGAVPAAIADSLRVPLGEVELILALRKFRDGTVRTRSTGTQHAAR